MSARPVATGRPLWRRAVGWALAGALCVGSTTGQASPLQPGLSLGVPGMAATEMGTVSAVAWNPASLGLSEHAFQFSITPVAAHWLTNAWEAGLLEQVIRRLDGRPLGAEEKEMLLAAVPPGGLRLDTALAHAVRLAIGPVALGVTGRIEGGAELTRDAAALWLQDPPPAGPYELAGTRMEGAAFLDASLALAVPAPWLAQPLHLRRAVLGGSVHVLRGYGFLRAQVAPAPACGPGGGGGGCPPPSASVLVGDGGRGFAFDLGVALEPLPRWGVEASLLNLGGLQWTNVREVTYQVEEDPGTGQRRLAESERPVAYPVDWFLPVVVRAGTYWRASDTLRFSLDYTQRLTGVGDGGGRVAAAMEFGWATVPLRLGASFAPRTGEMEWSLGAGLRLGPLAVDAGLPNVGALFGRGKGIGLAVTTGIRF